MHLKLNSSYLLSKTSIVLADLYVLIGRCCNFTEPSACYSYWSVSHSGSKMSSWSVKDRVIYDSFENSCYKRAKF